MFGKNYVSIMAYALISAVGLNCVTLDTWAQDLSSGESFNELVAEGSASETSDVCERQSLAGIKRCYVLAAGAPCTYSRNLEGGWDIDCTNNEEIQQCYARVYVRKERCLGDLQSFRDNREALTTKSRSIKSKEKTNCSAKPQRSMLKNKVTKCSKPKAKVVRKR